MNIAQRRDVDRATWIERTRAALHAPGCPHGIKKRYEANARDLLALRLVEVFGYDPHEIEGRVTAEYDRRAGRSEKTGRRVVTAQFILANEPNDYRSFEGWLDTSSPLTIPETLCYMPGRYVSADEYIEDSDAVVVYLKTADERPELAAFRDSRGWRDPAEAIARADADCFGIEFERQVDRIERDRGMAYALFCAEVAARYGFPLNRVFANTTVHDHRNEFGDMERPDLWAGEMRSEFIVEPVEPGEFALGLYSWTAKAEGFAPRAFEIEANHPGTGDSIIIPESEFPDAAALRDLIANVADRFPVEEAA